MEVEEHESIRHRDWRLQAVTVLAEDFLSPFTGVLHKAGTPVQNITFVEFDDNLLRIPVPNATALFLSLSWQMSSKAQSHFDQLKFATSSEGVRTCTDENNLFSGIECCMASVVFAYTALECYANEVIPDEYVYQARRGDGKCTELYNKEQIERFLSLDVKLGSILPEVLGIDSPKGSGIWDRYVTLKRLRDRIIHMKKIDRKGTKLDDAARLDHIWNELVVPQVEHMALVAKDMIAYFAKETPPRWLRKCPF